MKENCHFADLHALNDEVLHDNAPKSGTGKKAIQTLNPVHQQKREFSQCAVVKGTRRQKVLYLRLILKHDPTSKYLMIFK